ncbi:MAG: hypothetical protein Q4G27_02950 [Flavobacteriaceae bacterium]|nr:hypothetical protein [Flavobacteriaceae bacterium]
MKKNFPFDFTMKAYGLLLLIFTFVNSSVSGQDTVQPSHELKLKVETLINQKDIINANELVNTYLGTQPKFVLEILSQNLAYARRNKLKKEEANTYHYLGNLWFTVGNASKAYESYLKSESINKSRNDLASLAQSMQMRSNLVENLEERIGMLEKCAEIFEKEADWLKLAQTHMSLGIAESSFLDWNNPEKHTADEIKKIKEKAFFHYKKAENLIKNLNEPDKTNFSVALESYYAEWFQYERDFDNAIEKFKIVADLASNHRMMKGKVSALLQLSHIHLELQNYNEALQKLEEAQAIASKSEFNDLLVKIFRSYSVLYDSLQMPSQSLKYNKLYTEKALEVFQTNSQDKIQIVSLEHNLAENELKIEKYETQTRLNRTIILFSLISSLLIIGISYLIFKNNKRKIESLEKNKIITEVQLKNQLLEDELLKEKMNYAQNHLVTIANLSNKILNFLDELKFQVKDLSHNSVYIQGINDLKISFSKIVNDKNLLTEISLLSTELNQEFFIYLRKNYPEITKSDEQLLSFIILKMTSKEIGEMLKITTESVYIKRHRLRKKLDLPAEISFTEFYESTLNKIVTH